MPKLLFMPRFQHEERNLCIFSCFHKQWTSTTTILEGFHIPSKLPVQYECQNMNTILLSKNYLLPCQTSCPPIESIMVKHASSQALNSSFSPFPWFQPCCLWFFNIPPHPLSPATFQGKHSKIQESISF